MILMGMLAGAFWGFIPGYLKARFNVNEVISTLMLNYIAVSWNNYFIYAVWSEGGFQRPIGFFQNRDFEYAEPIIGNLSVDLQFVSSSQVFDKDARNYTDVRLQE